MKMKKNIFPYILMHAVFLLYSFYTVLGKIAAGYDFLSLRFCALYAALITVLAVYAVLWQQVLKRVKLSVAAANKAAVIVWGMVWGALFFGEAVTAKKIAAAAVIAAGILVISSAENESGGSR